MTARQQGRDQAAAHVAGGASDEYVAVRRIDSRLVSVGQLAYPPSVGESYMNGGWSDGVHEERSLGAGRELSGRRELWQRRRIGHDVVLHRVGVAPSHTLPLVDQRRVSSRRVEHLA